MFFWKYFDGETECVIICESWRTYKSDATEEGEDAAQICYRTWQNHFSGGNAFATWLVKSSPIKNTAKRVNHCKYSLTVSEFPSVVYKVKITEEGLRNVWLQKSQRPRQHFILDNKQNKAAMNCDRENENYLYCTSKTNFVNFDNKNTSRAPL